MKRQRVLCMHAAQCANLKSGRLFPLSEVVSSHFVYFYRRVNIDQYTDKSRPHLPGSGFQILSLRLFIKQIPIMTLFPRLTAMQSHWPRTRLYLHSGYFRGVTAALYYTSPSVELTLSSAR
jgi:hypothetical protein